MIITKTPFRVSLCGGGSDLPAFYENVYCVIAQLSINIFILHHIHHLIKIQ